MPVEIIGEAGTPGTRREWIDAECRLAIKHLKKSLRRAITRDGVGSSVAGTRIGYPTIVLTWEDSMRGAPWEYLERCEGALTKYENR